MTAPDLSPAEAAIVARFDAAPTLPESFDATAALRRVEAELLHLEQLARDYNGTILNPSTAFRSSAALIRAAIGGEEL